MDVTNHSTEHSTEANQPGTGTHLASVRNGLVGGVVAVLLSFLPLSTVLGGGVAGYLERQDGRRGGGAGAIAGLVAAMRFLIVEAYIVFAEVSLPGLALGLPPAVVVAGVTVVAVGYAVGLGVLGGLVGGYVSDERSR